MDDAVPDLGEDSYWGTGRLAGLRALITGAHSGIGAAIAIAVAFAREGTDITISYLSEEEEDAQHVMRLFGLRDAAQCRSLVAAAVEKMGALHGCERGRQTSLAEEPS